MFSKLKKKLAGRKAQQPTYSETTSHAANEDPNDSDYAPLAPEQPHMLPPVPYLTYPEQRQSYHQPRNQQNFEAGGTSSNPAGTSNYDFSHFMQMMTGEMAALRTSNEALRTSNEALRTNNDALTSEVLSLRHSYETDKQNMEANQARLENLIRCENSATNDRLNSLCFSLETEFRNKNRRIHEHLNIIQQEQHTPNYRIGKMYKWHTDQHHFPLGDPAPWLPTYIPGQVYHEQAVTSQEGSPVSAPYSDSAVRNFSGASNMDTTDTEAYFRPEVLTSSRDSSPEKKKRRWGKGKKKKQ